MTKRTTIRISIAVVFLSLLIAFTLAPFNVNSLLARPLLAERLLSTKADIAIVLGGGLRLNGSLSDLSAERVAEAMRIHQQTGIDLLFSGGETPSGVEAQSMDAYAKKLGYTGLEHIEASSHSTFENAFFSDQLLDQNRFPDTTVLLVTSPYHSRRALSTFRKLMPERHVFITYPDESVVFGSHPLARWRGLYAISREYAANAWYAVRYRVQPQGSPTQFAKGERLDFQMRDGVRVQGDYYEGVTDKAVVLVHGYASSRTVFEPLIPAFQAKGWHVLAVDLRGHGQSVGNYSAFTAKDFNAIPLDLVSLSEWLKSKREGIQITVVGADLGADAALNATALSEAFVGAVGISPSLENRGIAVRAVMNRLNKPVLFIAAKDDDSSYKATAELFRLAATRSDEKQFLEYQAGGHGTDLLFSTTALAGEIIDFIDQL